VGISVPSVYHAYLACPFIVLYNPFSLLEPLFLLTFLSIQVQNISIHILPGCLDDSLPPTPCKTGSKVSHHDHLWEEQSLEHNHIFILISLSLSMVKLELYEVSFREHRWFPKCYNIFCYPFLILRNPPQGSCFTKIMHRIKGLFFSGIFLRVKDQRIFESK